MQPPAPLTSLERAPQGTPLYVHLPFCKVKCPYCDFYSVVAEGHDRGAFLDLLLLEAEHRAPRSPATVFLGGGTPSLLDAPEIERLLDGLEARTGFRSSAREVTAECNPESLTQAKAEALLAGGVTRLSIGFQSLRPESLLLLGRPHQAEDSLRAFEAARRAGCQRLSVDLIYGTPGETEATWREDLTRILDLGPEHFSAYNLTYEPGTPLHAHREQGRVSQAPEELELALFHATRELAKSSGFAPYEISNYARAGQHCRHNVHYWENRPYLGIGPSAVSKLGHRRQGSPRSLTRWSEALKSGTEPCDWTETLEPLARLGETWWLGLRLDAGLDPGRARETAGAFPDPDPARAEARRLASQGLLEEVRGRWRLTPQGLPLGDAIGARFLGLQSDPPPVDELQACPSPPRKP